MAEAVVSDPARLEEVLVFVRWKMVGDGVHGKQRLVGNLL